MNYFHSVITSSYIDTFSITTSGKYFYVAIGSKSPQFALSYFLLFDAATLSSHAKPPPDAPYDVVPVHMAFVDWIPAICTTRTSRSP